MSHRWIRRCAMPVALACVGGSAAGFATATQAQAFPNKPVHLVVGFPPGGASDIVARLLQPHLQKELGQPFVIENRPGANGNIANEVVARAQPDGYTLLLGNPGPLVLNPYLYKRVPVDPVKAFVPVTQLTESPMVVVVPGNSPLKSMGDLLAKVRQTPGKVTYGSAGNGSSMHVAGATLQVHLNTPMIHVPYKGSGPALNDLLAGQLDFMADSRSTTLPLIRDGRLRALAVTGSRRVADLPDIPTVAEAGVKDFDVTTWLGVVAPAGTPAPVVQRLHSAFSSALRNPSVQARLAELGTGIKASTPAEFARALDTERNSARELVRESGMTIE